MKAEAGINQQLNMVLRECLTAINQYFLHARMLGNWGLKGLADQEYQASIRAMKMADDLIQRILFLEGLPNLQDLGKLWIGETVSEIITNDFHLESQMRQVVITAIEHCEKNQDYQSRTHLETILERVEDRIDWLENQTWLIENSGLANYLQSAMTEINDD